MVIVSIEVLTKYRSRVAGCETFEAFKDALLDYLDSCIVEAEAEEERLKQAAKEILGMT
jgi:hypothetical protein